MNQKVHLSEEFNNNLKKLQTEMFYNANNIQANLDKYKHETI